LRRMCHHGRPARESGVDVRPSDEPRSVGFLARPRGVVRRVGPPGPAAASCC